MGKRKEGPWKTITVGSSTVKIYHVEHKSSRTGHTHVLSWYGADKSRCTAKVADPKKAVYKARMIAEDLSSGRVESASFTQADRDELIAVRQICGDVPPVVALKEWRAARKLVNFEILQACEAWAARRGARKASISVKDAWKLFRQQKISEGVLVKSSYDRSIPSFVEAFGDQSISSVSVGAISSYLTRYKNGRSRNSHHKRIISMFRWCSDMEFLPLDIKTAPERVSRVKEETPRKETFPPDVLPDAFKLMSAKAPEYLPALVMAAFCGMRRVEVHAQRWEDIDLDRKFVRVTAAKRNTAAYRLIPLPDCAVAWLSDRKKDEGQICSNLAMDRIRDIWRTSGQKMAKNGFRHSWVSARVVVTGNIPQVAIEAGNSVSEINKHYRELMTPEDAKSWFSIFPEQI